MSQNTDHSAMSLYGHADAATAFDERHPQWTAVMSRLGAVVDLAFARTQVMDTPIEKFVYFYGTLVAEDFMEIFLLAANGYGYGAQKLLRSMYEHTITLKYLHDHPDELQTFFDFDRVQQYKLMKPIFEIFGETALPPNTVAEAERKYAEVKGSFTVKSCKSNTCDEKRMAVGWSKLDFVSMARKTGPLGSLIVQGYYYPMRHVHGTYRAMTERLEVDDEQMGFKREAQPEEADQALMTAHNCLIVALDVQEERFSIDGLKAAIQDAMHDWTLVWSPELLSRLQADEKCE